MERRLNLSEQLKCLGYDHRYFQPPENLKLQYPCVVYERSSNDVKFANDSLYNHKTKYTLTFITYDPDFDVEKVLRSLKYSSYDRHFVSDGLHHDVFSIYI